MTAYYFNEGTFDSLDVGVVDTTIHILELADGARLFVERTGVREGATLEAVARDRTRRESQQRERYTLIHQHETRTGELVGFDVGAYFREGAEVRYQLQRHVIRGQAAFLFTLTGPVAAKPELDARMSRVFETLRFRG